MQQSETLAPSLKATNCAKSLTYGQRAQLATNPVAKRLFETMERKRTNLIVSADVTEKKALLELIDAVGPHVCAIKTHIDIVNDFDWDLIEQLQQLARIHDFIIFEDRKFADIGNTVQLQYQQGIYRIAEWADMVNAHSVPGPGIIEGLRAVGLTKNRALILLPQMSSKDNLATGDYTQKTVAWAQQYDDFVIGFIARQQLVEDQKFLHFTPGVQLALKGDALGQQYLTPQVAIRDGSDCIIVGRGIYHADNYVAAAQEYQVVGWESYLKRI
jgi:orotidine 5'-phosphate decarboxylase subfamily 1